MKKILSLIFIFVFVGLANNDVRSQTLKVGVFDLDLMVQAMPAYQAVDSLMQIYDRDSLGAEEEYNQMEYKL
jgi:hypothetical protein